MRRRAVLTGKSALIVVLLPALMVVAAAGCGDDDPGTVTSAEPAPSSTSSLEGATQPGSTVTSAGPEDTAPASGDSGLSAEQAESAVDIARAYLVARTDFTGDQFDWAVEAAALDDEGTWWARVSATPVGDNTLEIEQVYVYSPADSGFWFAHDMGTGIDPATDESFPEEVRDRL